MDAVHRRAEEILVQAEGGNAEGLNGALAGLNGGDSQTLAWQLALQAARVSFDPRATPAPKIDMARALLDASLQVRAIVRRAADRMVLACALAFDLDALREWRATGDAAGVSGVPWIGGLADVVEGHTPLSGDAEVLSPVLRALGTVAADVAPGALATVREASGRVMGAGTPELEYVTHLALARLRRSSGRPHLALHILTGLARSAPPSWHGWVAWELLLAGGEQQAQSLLEAGVAASPARRMASAGVGLLRAARAGDRVRFDDARAQLRDERPPWAALAAESESLVAILDPYAQPPDEATAAWFRGDRVLPPHGLHAAGSTADAALETERGFACVLAAPGVSPRRLLAVALPMAGDGVKNLAGPDERNKGGFRTETGLAVLALAGPAGDRREDFVRKVYGFRYDGHRHQGVLDVLVHRMRARLPAVAVLERDEISHRLRLIVGVPLVVPDGRTTVPLADRVLRALASKGWTGAQGAADALRIPLRTIQRALQDLVEEGACKLLRENGRVSYRVHDTTFTTIAVGPLASRPPG